MQPGAFDRIVIRHRVNARHRLGGRECAPQRLALRAGIALGLLAVMASTAHAQSPPRFKPRGYFANWPPRTSAPVASSPTPLPPPGDAKRADNRRLPMRSPESQAPWRASPAVPTPNNVALPPRIGTPLIPSHGAPSLRTPAPPGRPPFASSFAPPAGASRRAPPLAAPLPPAPPRATTGNTDRGGVDEDDDGDDDDEDDDTTPGGRDRPTYFPDRFSWGEDEESPLEEDQELLAPFLMSETFRRQTQLHTFGWLQQSYTVNPAYPSSRLNGITAPNDRANDYQMNELYLVVERRINRNLGQADFGARFDLLYGTSAFAYQAAGLDNEIVSRGSNRFYQLAIPQAFVSAYFPNLPGVNGTTLQAGHYYSTLGYEYLAPHNFFFSFANYNLGIPFTNTGGLATLQLTDHVVTQQGFSRGWDIFNNPRNNRLSYTGSLQWFDPDQETWAYLAWMVGPELVGRQGRRGFNNLQSLMPLAGVGAVPVSTSDETELRAVVSLFIEQQVTERLEYALVAGVGHQNGSANGLVPTFDWGWVANYAYYTLSPHWAAGVRAEWFHDAHGLFTTPPRQPGLYAPGDLYEVTLGLNWQPQPWVRVRPEVRWDWQTLNDATALPSFNDNRSLHQFLFAVDALVTF